MKCIAIYVKISICLSIIERGLLGSLTLFILLANFINKLLKGRAKKMEVT